MNWQHAAKLKDFVLLRRGNRLSVMPVPQSWEFVLTLE
jgi:predicted RNA-binding protein with PUA-like domain